MTWKIIKERIVPLFSVGLGHVFSGTTALISSSVVRATMEQHLVMEEASSNFLMIFHKSCFLNLRVCCWVKIVISDSEEKGINDYID
jgi:hypothetical protein